MVIDNIFQKMLSLWVSIVVAHVIPPPINDFLIITHLKSLSCDFFDVNNLITNSFHTKNSTKRVSDVALALGYQWAGIRNIQHVPVEWRRVESVSTLRRGMQESWFLSEQGLYFFLGRSDKPGALPFQKWLAGEVLPAIRKTGGYTLMRKRALLCRQNQRNLPCPMCRKC